MLTTAPIPDLDTQFARTRRITLMLIGIVGIGVLITGAPFLWGMAVGLTVGLFNAFTLTNRLKRLGDFNPPKAKGYMKQGMAMRFTLIFAVLFMVTRIHWIDLHGVGAGILIPPLVAIFDLAVCTFKESFKGPMFKEAMASQAIQMNPNSNTKGGEKS